MKLLTFDTCLDRTYVALSEDGTIIESKIVENKNEKYHSAFLISTIVNILKNNNLTMQNIDAIGTNIGPGSFTGIRACVTVARVIAQQLNCPLVGVSSLEILSNLNRQSKKTAVMLDARKKQFYLALYDTDGRELLQPQLINDEKACDYTDCIIISDEAVQNFLAQKGVKTTLYKNFSDEIGLILNRLAFEKLKCGDYHWAKLKPLYLQAPPISKPKVAS